MGWLPIQTSSNNIFSKSNDHVTRSVAVCPMSPKLFWRGYVENSIAISRPIHWRNSLAFLH
jgi:hypothetical protein